MIFRALFSVHWCSVHRCWQGPITGVNLDKKCIDAKETESGLLVDEILRVLYRVPLPLGEKFSNAFTEIMV